MALLAWVFFRLVFSAFITCGRSCAEGNYTIGVDTHLISEEIEAVHLRGDGGLSRAFCPAAEDSLSAVGRDCHKRDFAVVVDGGKVPKGAETLGRVGDPEELQAVLAYYWRRRLREGRNWNH